MRRVPNLSQKVVLKQQASGSVEDTQRLGVEFLKIIESVRTQPLLLLVEKNPQFDVNEDLLSEQKDDVPNKEVKQEAVQYSNPFTDFMGGIRLMTDPVVETPDEMMKWSGLPLEDMISDGLWLVMQKLSQKYGMRLSTEADVVEKMSVIVNYLVGLGLNLKYGIGNAKAACVDFEKTVLPEIRMNLRKLAPGEAVEPAEIWRVPVAQFFAKLINFARERVKQQKEVLERWDEDLQNTNWFLDKRDVVYIPIDEFPVEYIFSWLSEISAILDFVENPHYEIGILVRKVFFAMNDLPNIDEDSSKISHDYVLWYATYVKTLKVLKKLPVNLRALPLDTNSFITIQRHWINTQVACEILRLEKDFLNEDDLSELAAVIHLVDLDVVIQGVFIRWEKRGAKLSNEDKACIVDIIHEGFNLVKAMFKDGVINFDKEKVYLDSLVIYRLEKLDTDLMVSSKKVAPRKSKKKK